MPKKSIEQMHNEKQARIANAINQKQLSIAFHSSGNIAAELMKSYPEEVNTKKKFLKVFQELREHLYLSWQTWHLDSIPEPPKESYAVKRRKLIGKSLKDDMQASSRKQEFVEFENKEAEQELPVIEQEIVPF